MAAIIQDFNNIIIDLANQLTVICPNSLIANNIDLLKKIINNNSTKNKIIEIFIAYVLPYKKQIDMGDEIFFLNNSFDKETNGQNAWVSKIFEFKNIWKELKNENKTYVIQYMQILCKLAQEYFLLIDAN